VLDGSCRTPIAGLATISGSDLTFSGLVLSPEGDEFHEGSGSGPASDAEALGRNAGLELRSALPPALKERLGLT
jgi:hydroxymethylbilane synthase